MENTLYWVNNVTVKTGECDSSWNPTFLVMIIVLIPNYENSLWKNLRFPCESLHTKLITLSTCNLDCKFKTSLYLKRFPFIDYHNLSYQIGWRDLFGCELKAWPPVQKGWEDSNHVIKESRDTLRRRSCANKTNLNKLSSNYLGLAVFILDPNPYA